MKKLLFSTCSPQVRFRNGFTLIELLVVIAIVALLAAILFPVFSRVRENGRRSSCQSNLKQIGLGLLQYVQDFDERTVSRFYAATTADNNKKNMDGSCYTWADAIYPYVKSEQIFNCPSHTLAVVNSSTGAFRYYGNITSPGIKNFHVSYAINDTGSNSAVIGAYSPVDKAISAIEDPTGTLWVADSAQASTAAFTFGGSNVGVYGEEKGFDTFGVGANSRLHQRHLETTNVLYCDGHVKAQAISALLTPTSTLSSAYAAIMTIRKD